MDRDIDSAQRHARSGGNTDVFLAAVAASDAWSEFLSLAIAAGLLPTTPGDSVEASLTDETDASYPNGR